MIGDIETKKLILNDEVAKELGKRFIALDTETTGLDCTNNQITEIGMCLFEDGKLVKEFNSLVSINELIPDHIVELTGITNEMIKNAPKPEIVYSKVVEFMGDALDEGTIIVAHNASFDMGFIKHTLKRYGYIGVIRYVDTLNISRSLIKGLFNYKQDTVATYFNIVNDNAHRALSDARTCGNILVNLLNVYNTGSQVIDFKTKYDNQFELKVIERGIIYYRFNTINNYLVNNNIITGNIMGANNYDVSIKINEDSIEGNCTCPYYTDNKLLCKHIYALLLKYTSNNKDE